MEKKEEEEKRGVWKFMPKDRLSSTTSSLYLNSTLNNVNVKSIMQAVSTILHS
jgi:hypothetical protein